MAIPLRTPDRENFADRVISDPRLIELLLERDKEIYRLESELGKAHKKLGEIALLQKILNEL